MSTFPAETAETATNSAAASDAHRRSADWDIRAGAGNYAVLVGTQVLASGAAFAAVFVALRAMGAAGYGRVAAVIAAAQLVMQVALNWSTFSVGRFGGEEFNRTGRIAHAFWTRLTLLLPPLVAVAAASPLWLPPVGRWLKLSPADHPLVLAYLVVSLFWMHVQQALQAAKLQRLRGVLLAGERVLVLAALVVLAASRHAHLLNVMGAYILAAAVCCAAGLWHVRRLIRPVRPWDRPLLKKMLWFSLPLIPSALAGYLTGGYLDALFITRYLGLADLGTYSVAYAIAGSFLQLPTLLNTLLLSLFISLQGEGRNEAVGRYLRNVTPLLVLGWSAGCSLAAFALTWLLPLFPGPEYAAMSRLMWPLMAMAALSGPMLLGYTAVVSAWSATHLIPLSSVLQAAVNVLLNFVLIPRYGLVGCAWASAAAGAVGLLALAFFVSRRVRGGAAVTLAATVPAVAGAAATVFNPANFLLPVGVCALAFLLVASWRRREFADAVRILLRARAVPLPRFLLRRPLSGPVGGVPTVASERHS